VELAAYVAHFNAAVRDGSWSSVLEHYTDDAVMEFVGPPVGPFVGKPAIAAAYRASPPDDEIELIGSPDEHGGMLVTAYRWRATGATGSMGFTERDGLIEHLVITFD
jgi:steroid delta-isomerase